MEKTLNNTSADQAKAQVPDIEIFGDPDTFKLICKASSKKQGWMKSTKAMEIKGVGCVVQVTTHQLNRTGLSDYKYENEKVVMVHENVPAYDWEKEIMQSVISEALTFVPGVKIQEEKKSGKVISRKLVSIK